MCVFLVFPERHLLRSVILNPQKIFGAMEKVQKLCLEIYCNAAKRATPLRNSAISKELQ
jgi:hypothetical protein